MNTYPPGWDPEIHSEMSATDAATDIVESQWRVMEATAKQEKIEEYAQMIIETRREVLQISRDRHPAGFRHE